MALLSASALLGLPSAGRPIFVAQGWWLHSGTVSGFDRSCPLGFQTLQNGGPLKDSCLLLLLGVHL